MIKQILFIILLISTKFYAQEINFSELNDSWIKYKIEMKDGSKLIDRFLTDSSYVNYSFTNNRMCINGNPTHRVNEVCLPFTIKRDFIKTSATSGYSLERIKNDTLIICEKIKGMEDERLKRFYFVREKKLFNEIKEQKGSEKNQVANEFYTPTLKSSLMLELNKAFKKKHSNFKLKGQIIIDLINKKIQTQITYTDTTDSSKIKRVKKTIEKSYKLWDLERFNRIKTIQLPFILKDKKTKTSWGISMKFFTTSFYHLDTVHGGDLNTNIKVGEYFAKAIEAFQSKDYNNSIFYFSKSYELDSKNIDALYNRTAIYHEIGKTELACKDWRELSQLGQKKGKELLNNHCK